MGSVIHRDVDSLSPLPLGISVRSVFSMVIDLSFTIRGVARYYHSLSKSICPRRFGFWISQNTFEA